MLDKPQKSVMDRILRVLAVVQDTVRHMVHEAAVFQINLLKLHLFLRRVEHLQIIDKHQLHLLRPSVGCGIRDKAFYLLSANAAKNLSFARNEGMLCLFMALSLSWVNHYQ